KYFLSKNISLFANLGYRYASIPEVRAKKDVDMNDDGVISEDDIEKGEPMKDIEDKAVPFDYSGLVFNIGFGIKF
ncbi:MAG: hypothetical protein RMJ67_08665, partial [Elusimicrobiota bacterium]|nr:hypothetical protein [Endomicrobiia bacterium]MDW8166567.1 hypothetical protein [Elusimicrobiota bacterium]